MSFVGDKFIRSFGKPSPAAKQGVVFGDEGEQRTWTIVQRDTGAGFFLDGFVYLFGEGLDALLPCLDAWSFLLPKLPAPMVVGYNAFGTLLVVKDRRKRLVRLGVLDPARVVWWAPADLDFTGLLGNWLPERSIPHFLEHDAYDAWRAAGGRRLRVGEMLSMKTPAALGGAFEPGNFEIAEIAGYYQASGPVYAKTHAKSKPKPKPGKKK